ncbi:MAG TPA: hypothetical protein DCX08_07375 [Porticoccaceae bacterium]|jgi:hypothetical protein|nr:hypothetical protein [Porticoccaceae bacterium]
MFKTIRSSAPKVQLLHVTLCVIWNMAGLWQLLSDLQPIGPTASMTTIGLLIVFAATLVLSERNNQWVPYLLVSGLLGIGAVTAIFGALTKDPLLWPAEFWRYVGIAINSIGVVGFGLALAHIKHLRM